MCHKYYNFQTNLINLRLKLKTNKPYDKEYNRQCKVHWNR